MKTKKIKRGGFAVVADPVFAEGSTARLVTGHSLQWLKAQPSKSISIFFFSPPYNKRRPGGDKCGGALWNAQLAEGYASFGDDMAHLDYVAWMHEVITECWRVLKDDGAIFFQHKDQPFKGKLLTPEELIPADVLAHLRQRIIWHRQAAYTPNKNFLNPSFEFIHLLAKPQFKFATSGKLFDVLSIRPVAKIDPNHPAPMPVELPQRIFEQLKPEHDVICDVFSGSGTTGVAARATGRHYVGIELDAGYNATAAVRLGCDAPSTFSAAPVLDIVDEIIAAKRAAYWAAQREQDPAIRYATLCSGVEAVSLAWEGLGYQAEFFSEVGKFQSEFLAERYPTVPNVGDMTLIDGRAYAGKLDVFWASTPCQTFSRDGDGAALDDARGALTMTAVRLADEINPPVFILENVPDLLTIDNGEAFGQVLAALVGEDVPLVPAGRRWTNAGAVRGPRRNLAWRVLDAQYSGLAQRRQRVFVVACPVGGPDPAAIILEQGEPRQDCRELQKLQAAEAKAYAAGRSVMWFNGDKTPKFNEQIAYTLKANAAYGNLSGVLIDGEAYRLSPEDREALMGMPRGYTDVPTASDSSRNEAIGNSLAVPDVRWLGERVKTALKKPKPCVISIANDVEEISYRIAA